MPEPTNTADATGIHGNAAEVTSLSTDHNGTRARNALWLTFFTMGLVSMAWVPRIPEFQTNLGLSDGQFGFVLLGTTFGAVPGAQLAGRLIHRFSSRPIMVIAGFIMPTGLVVMALSDTVPVLMAGMFLLGFSFATLDVACNTQAIAVERLVERRFMSSFHGMWSIGSLVVTVLGGALAHVLTPRENLLIIAVPAYVMFLVGTTAMLRAGHDGHKGSDGETTRAKVPFVGVQSLLLWGLGIGLVGALIPEASAADWSGILLRDHMGVGKGVTASAFAAFTLAMIVSRFAGDAVMARIGPVATVRWGGYIGGVSMGLGVAIGVPLSHQSTAAAVIVVCIGFAIAGLGIGPMFPAYMSAAGQIPGIAPSVGMARIGIISLAGYFGGPSVIGAIAEVVSLPVAMGFPAAFLVLAGRQARYIARTRSASVL